MKTKTWVPCVYMLTSTLLLSCAHHRRQEDLPLGTNYVPTLDSARYIDEPNTPPAEKSCVRLVTRVQPTLKALLGKLNAQSKGKKFAALRHLNRRQCEGDLATGTVKFLTKILAPDGRKIGIILPRGTQANLTALSLLSGARAFCRSDLPCLSRIVPAYSDGTRASTVRALARLVLKDEVGLIIGGLRETGAQVLAEVGHTLFLPVLILNSSEPSLTVSPFVMRTFPQETSMAKALVGEIALRKIGNIMLLKPDNGKSDVLVASLKSELTASGITASEVAYRSGDYVSMDLAVQSLKGSVVNTPVRQGVFIPDNFRIVRHFANLLKFHEVPEVTLIGNNEWRGSRLLDPWEPTLRGAFFADYVGPYSTLPPGISASFDQSEYFVLPEEASSIDLQLIGYRALGVATKALQTIGPRKRRFFARVLSGKKTTGQGPGFTAKELRPPWPTFVFVVGDRTLHQSPQAGAEL